MNSGRFKPGQKPPPNAGRKKGSKAKYKLPSVAQVLKEEGIDPLKKLIDLAESGTLKAADQRKVWSDILSYTRPKSRPSDENVSPAPGPEVSEQVVPTAQLLQLAKGEIPPKKAGGSSS